MAAVLLVEDERIVADDIAKSLETFGYTVCGVASSGAEALKKVEETHPDLILMDIILKGNTDGIEIAHQVKSLFDIPVIYLTAHADDDTLARARVTEPYGYVLKPFQERELHAAVEMALHKHKMEKTVRDNRLHLAPLTSMCNGVITTDARGMITFMNPVAETLTGYRQQEALGTPVESIVGTGTELIIAEILQNPSLSGISDQTILVPRNRAEIPIEAAAVSIKSDGIVTGAVLIFCDITKRTEVEEALMESETLYKALFDRTLNFVYVHDFEGRFLDCNQAALAALNYTREELPFLSVYSLLDEDQAPLALRTIEDIIKTGTQKMRTEYKLRKKDGTYIWVETEGSLIYRHGEPYAIQGIARDITERKKTEMQLQNLFRASKLINSTMDIKEIFQYIGDSVQELVGFDHFVIFLISEGGVNPAHTKGAFTDRLLSGELVNQCIRTGESVLQNHQSNLKMFGTDGVSSVIVIPLVVETECVGALHISHSMSNAYHQDDMNVLNLLGEVVSSAIKNSQLYDEIHQLNTELEKRIQERSQKTEIILNAKKSLQTETSWEKGLTIIVESIHKLGFERCGVFLVDSLKKRLEFHFGKGVDLSKIEKSIPLKNGEYFGVKCVTQKKTIHITDSCSIEGKQITTDSPSFVWVPIIVQGEVFAALAADNVKSRKTITSEDVKDLEILAGTCAAFIDKTRVLLEPEAEKKLKTTVKFWLNPSEGYIINEKKPRKCFDIFVDLVTHGVPGFVISREHPEKIRRKYSLLKTPMLWLSKSGAGNTIDPHDLSKLIYIIEDFTRKSEESVVLLEGVEYLITQTNFDAVMKYMHELKDIVILHNSRLIIPLHRETLSVKECCLLERDFTILEGD